MADTGVCMRCDWMVRDDDNDMQCNLDDDKPCTHVERCPLKVTEREVRIARASAKANFKALNFPRYSIDRILWNSYSNSLDRHWFRKNDGGLFMALKFFKRFVN